jgi:hypothetical protein
MHILQKYRRRILSFMRSYGRQRAMYRVKFFLNAFVGARESAMLVRKYRQKGLSSLFFSLFFNFDVIL